MIYNKVFLVNSEIVVDIGVTSFSLYNGDLLFTNNDRICKLVYGTDNNVLELKESNQRVFTSIRVANQTVGDSLSMTWIPMSRCLGKQLDDITSQWKRNQLLEELI